MSVHGDSEALTIEGAGSAESLVDPALFAGRTLELKNNANVAQTWSSVGATPFVVGGANVATLTIPVGEARRVYSNGTRWVLVSGSGSRPFFAATAVTDASGNATFAFPAGLFSAAPVLDVAIQFAAGSNPIDYRATTLTATSAVVNVRQSPTLVVLSLSVLGVAAPIAGVTVHAIATPAGATP
ncbi:hypothetical protein [Streptomyces sp. NBC_00425]|uniref:hypothetical protein n=1 Tax=Streptomyces sp. NBC_00425 TaxID=2975740 RepID=UPI002E244C6F